MPGQNHNQVFDLKEAAEELGCNKKQMIKSIVLVAEDELLHC
ncbi:hypothetical protein [Archaeoglobus sp.]